MLKMASPGGRAARLGFKEGVALQRVTSVYWRPERPGLFWNCPDVLGVRQGSKRSPIKPLA